MSEGSLDVVWRASAPRVLGALVRRYGHFDAAEDALQEALVAAARQWPVEGVPSDPPAWLVRVASRRLIDRLRADAARVQREHRAGRRAAATDFPAGPEDTSFDGDDTLALMLLCCHPSSSRPSQVALTLRAVGGLTTAQIARSFLVPESTMAQRISRAKARLDDIADPFGLPTVDEMPERVAAVAHVLYLVFTEGHATTTGGDLTTPPLGAEAIRLARELHRALPDDGEVAGLLALMLLTDARRSARIGADGSFVPLAEQDRTRWNHGQIAEGVSLIEAALPTGPVGPYQLQAAIAAVHDEADSAEATDWVQIERLYEMLDRIAPGPMVTLNRAVAVAEVHGPTPALELIGPLLGDRRLRHTHRLHTVHAYLLELAGRTDEAHETYLLAARQATSIPEQQHLYAMAGRLGHGGAPQHDLRP
ncbi:MAG: RNA polymerase sigma factor [Actinobacteria bacterium]|nr:RNA polymerase sigma factor [Actinomycetota bacterium]